MNTNARGLTYHVIHKVYFNVAAKDLRASRAICSKTGTFGIRFLLVTRGSIMG